MLCSVCVNQCFGQWWNTQCLCESVLWAVIEHTDATQCLCESMFWAMMEQTDATECFV